MERIAVIGASLAGLSAAKSLRREGFTGELTVVGAESERPYDRPPLSKRLLAGSVTPDDITLDLGEAVNADWRLGVQATRLDAETRTVWIGPADEPEQFDGIVIATGASALRPRLRGSHSQPGGSAERELAGIHVVRTLSDSQALAADLQTSPARVVVVGAGFIGAEVASTCRELGLSVSVIEGQSVPMELALGHPIGTAMARRQRDYGVDLRLGTTVTEVRGADRIEEVALADGTALAADVVVLAVGVRPNTSWLEGSGLTLEGGVLCDETGLAAPGIVAAGDVVIWPNRRYGEIRRVEHWDNAIRQGQHAARRLLHGPEVYQPVPWFWSDQFGAKLQLLGSARSVDEFRLVAGSLDGDRFLGLYRRDDRVVAAASLNSARAMLTCRGLLDRNANWDEALAAFDHVPSPV